MTDSQTNWELVQVWLYRDSKLLLFCSNLCVWDLSYDICSTRCSQFSTDHCRPEQRWPVWVNGVYKIFILAACLLLHIKHSVVILITCRHTFIIFSSNSPLHTHAAPAPSTLTQPITNQTRLKEDDYPWGFYLSVFKWWNNVHTWTIGFAFLQYFLAVFIFSIFCLCL